MRAVKRVVFVIVAAFVLAMFALGLVADGREPAYLRLVTPGEAAALVSGLRQVEPDSAGLSRGTLTIEGADAPFVRETACYYIPQSLETETLDGLIGWSDRSARVYLVAERGFDKKAAIREGAPLALLVCSGSKYFYCSAVLTGLPAITLDSAAYPDGRDDAVPVHGGLVRIFDPAGGADGGYAVFTAGVDYARRGGDSVNYAKPQYTIEFFRNGRHRATASVLGLDPADRVLLSAYEFECAKYRDALARDIWNAICDTDDGRGNCKTPPAAFTEVFENDAYLGLYGAFVQTPAQVSAFPQTASLIKIKWMPGAEVRERDRWTGRDARIEAFLFNVYMGDTADRTEAQTYVRTFAGDEPGCEPSCDMLNGSNTVDYVLFANAASAYDNIRCNFFLYRPDAKTAFVRIPWDTDRSFGRMNGSDLILPRTFPPGFLISTTECAFLLGRYGEQYWPQVTKRWAELRRGPLATDRIVSQIDAYYTRLSDSGAYVREAARWYGGDDPSEASHEQIAAYVPAHLAALDEVFSADTPEAFLGKAVIYRTE